MSWQGEMITDSRFPSVRRFRQDPRREYKCVIDPRFYLKIERSMMDLRSSDHQLQMPEENIWNDMPKETHRLSIINMDWTRVSAKDLLLFLNPFLPKDGRILSVAVYPTEIRFQMDEMYGPDKIYEDDDDLLNQAYHAVAECDSTATAAYLFKSCGGIEFQSSSNKLDLNFIPNSTQFNHPPRDIANEESPAGYDVDNIAVRFSALF